MFGGNLKTWLAWVYVRSKARNLWSMGSTFFSVLIVQLMGQGKPVEGGRGMVYGFL